MKLQTQFFQRNTALLVFVCTLAPIANAATPLQKAPTNKRPAQEIQKAPANKEWMKLKAAADTLSLNGNNNDAQTQYQSALDNAEKSTDQNAIITCLIALSNCLAAQENKFSEELPLRIKAKELSEKVYGAQSVQFAERLADLADLYARKGEIEQAREYTDQAQQILGQSDDKNPLGMAACYQSLASRQIAAGTFGLAEEPLKKAVDLRSKNLSANDPLMISTLRRYSDLLKKWACPERS